MKTKPHFRWSLIALLAVWLGSLAITPSIAAQEPTADGLYAEFATSLGSYWCRLEFEKTPRTVASFVSLAEGTRDWVDFESAAIRRQPFYDGLKFHRVITGFMNQSGSPNGEGTDGPGYQFRDEIHPELRHNKAGILSMANSGTNSNGSQFFVTVEPTPWLDNKHTVFGEVVQGYDVVANINATAGTASGAPKTTVTINQIRILRRGAAATAFDPALVTPALPQVGTLTSQIVSVGGTLFLTYPLTPPRKYHVCYGTDLTSWFTTTFDTGPVDLTPLRTQPHVYFYVLWGGTEP